MVSSKGGRNGVTEEMKESSGEDE